MAGVLPRLTLGTACLVTKPHVVLRINHIMGALPRTHTDISSIDQDTEISRQAAQTVQLIEWEINHCIDHQGLEAESAVPKVLSEWSIDYCDESDAFESSLAAAQGLLDLASNPRKGVGKVSLPEAQPETTISTPGEVQFTAVEDNVPLNNAAQDGEMAHRTRNNVTHKEKPGTSHNRQYKRLKPEEVGVRVNRENCGIRFCWNIGWWLEGDKPYQYFETLAGGLLDLAQTHAGLSEVEREFVRNNLRPGRDVQQAEDKFRSVRARIIIGCACLQEYNIRGHKLNEFNIRHPALRPSGSRFKHLNFSAANIQLFCSGVDVNYTTKVFHTCRSAGRLPPDEYLSRHSESFRADHRVEMYLPAPSRKLVYQQLILWYYQRSLPPELCFVVSEADLGFVPQTLSSESSTASSG